jgi:hypothetical protein
VSAVEHCSHIQVAISTPTRMNSAIESTLHWSLRNFAAITEERMDRLPTPLLTNNNAIFPDVQTSSISPSSHTPGCPRLVSWIRLPAIHPRRGDLHTEIIRTLEPSSRYFVVIIIPVSKCFLHANKLLSHYTRKKSPVVQVQVLRGGCWVATVS